MTGILEIVKNKTQLNVISKYIYIYVYISIFLYNIDNVINHGKKEYIYIYFFFFMMSHCQYCINILIGDLILYYFYLYSAL